MIIRNLTKKYMVTQEYLGNENVRQYICYELDEPEKSQYCAVCQKISSVRGEEIRFLMEEMKNENFSDLSDFFINDNCLYVLLKHHVGDELGHKIVSEKFSLDERLEIIKNLLEKILILNMPVYFFASAMDVSRIIISKGNEVNFTYDCRNMIEFDTVQFQNGAEALADVIKFVFTYELKERSMPELETFVYNLGHNGMTKYLEIYEKYWQVYQIYFGIKQENLEPRSFKFKVWDFIKKVGSFIKKLIQPALLMLAVGYLVVSIMGVLAEHGVNDNFKSIGTVIVNNKDTSNDGQSVTDNISEETELEKADTSGVE